MPTVRRLPILAPVALGLCLLVGALATIGIATGGSGEAHVVRQVFTERSEYTKGATETVAEAWTLIGSDGRVTAFIGRYFDSQGTLRQAQYRTADGEVVYWTGYQGGKDACVEKAPPSPQGLSGLIPESGDESSVRDKGYVPGGQAGSGALSPTAIQHPRESPLTSKAVDLGEATLWSMTLQGSEGDRRERTLALDGDGLVAGFWSVTKGPSGDVLGSNSRVVSVVETYEANVFDRILSEVDFDDAPTCQ